MYDGLTQTSPSGPLSSGPPSGTKPDPRCHGSKYLGSRQLRNHGEFADTSAGEFPGPLTPAPPRDAWMSRVCSSISFLELIAVSEDYCSNKFRCGLKQRHNTRNNSNNNNISAIDQ